MSKKHTPGEWSHEPLDKEYVAVHMRGKMRGHAMECSVFSGKDGDGDDVCIGRFIGLECEANAMLACAAPDLLEACREAFEIHRDAKQGEYDFEIALQLRAAIAKAGG